MHDQARCRTGSGAVREMRMKQAIWLISGGPMQILAARKIKQKGFALILSDRNPSAPCAALADRFVELDTFDVDGHLVAADALRDEFDIQAVLTAAADCHYTVARTAEHLGVHHLSPEISKNCRNKLATREILTAAGLPQPLYHGAESYDEGAAFIEAHPGVPFVVKSTDNSGSRGLSTVLPGQKLTGEQFHHAQANGTTGLVIIEEMLQSAPDLISESSVETVWSDGKMHWVNWVDRIFPRDLCFFLGASLSYPVADGVEIGHVNPSSQSEELRQEVEDMIFAAGMAMGFDVEAGGHILKADMFFSTRGPMILELTPRISGGWDSSGSSPARGGDIVGGVIELAQGKSLTPELFDRYFRFDDPGATAVVLTSVPENAVDCIGRQFAIASGYEPTSVLINQALSKVAQGAFITPDLGVA
jgi:biotin carboxylase